MIDTGITLLKSRMGRAPLAVIAILAHVSSAADIIRGTVQDSASNAGMDSVSVSASGATTATAANGSFALTLPTTGIGPSLPMDAGARPESIELRDFHGGIVGRISEVGLETWNDFLIRSALPPGVYFATVRSRAGDRTFTVCLGPGLTGNPPWSGSGLKLGAPFAKAGSALLSQSYSVTFSKPGYTPKSMDLPANTAASENTVKLAKGLSNTYVTLFDGTNLDNWEYNSSFSIQDGAITGQKCWCMAFTKKDYGKYRLLLNVRIKSPTGGSLNKGMHMLGVEIWGARHTGDYTPKGTIHIVPPMSWTWDYLHNTGLSANIRLQKDPGFDWNAWNAVEILSDVVKGEFRMAVNGVEVLSFTPKVLSDWHVGPIGLLNHVTDMVGQYKDIRIEENPVNFTLITLKP